MALSTISVGGQEVRLVARPGVPLRSVEWKIDDTVATVSYVFTRRTQRHLWPGADLLSGTMTFPPLTQLQADAVISFLMQLRGQANAFRLGDPLKVSPAGCINSLSVPVADGDENTAGSSVLNVRGLQSGIFGLLLPGDWLESGYRLYRNLDRVNADASGRATLNIWPSLREDLPDGAPLNFDQPQGLFSLASNQRTWSAEYTRLTSISYSVQEWR